MLRLTRVSPCLLSTGASRVPRASPPLPRVLLPHVKLPESLEVEQGEEAVRGLGGVEDCEDVLGPDSSSAGHGQALLAALQPGVKRPQAEAGGEAALQVQAVDDWHCLGMVEQLQPWQTEQSLSDREGGTDVLTAAHLQSLQAAALTKPRVRGPTQVPGQQERQQAAVWDPPAVGKVQAGQAGQVNSTHAQLQIRNG